MNSKANRRIVLSLAAEATNSAQKYSKAEQSSPVREARQADRDFAQKILTAAEKAESVEELVFIEKSLQKFDLMKAKTPEDRSSIVASQKRYEQLGMTLEQMRKNPDGYIMLCMANIKNANADPYKIMMDNSLSFINGNVTRMRNRASFASDSEREVWNARIIVAKKTAGLFRELHESLAAAFEQKRQTSKKNFQ